MTQTGCTLISRVRMAEYGSSRYSSETDDDYDLSISPSISSEASEEIYLSSPPLETDVRPYRFEPVLPPTAVLIVIPMMEFTTLLFLSLHLLIAWGILTGKFVYKYKKAAFTIARES